MYRDQYIKHKASKRRHTSSNKGSFLRIFLWFILTLFLGLLDVYFFMFFRWLFFIPIVFISLIYNFLKLILTYETKVKSNLSYSFSENTIFTSLYMLFSFFVLGIVLIIVILVFGAVDYFFPSEVQKVSNLLENTKYKSYINKTLPVNNDKIYLKHNIEYSDFLKIYEKSLKESKLNSDSLYKYRVIYLYIDVNYYLKQERPNMNGLEKIISAKSQILGSDFNNTLVYEINNFLIQK